MMKRHRTFWKWLILWARAGAMSEARKKRIIHENLDVWNQENRAFVDKCNRESDAIIGRPSADEANGTVADMGHHTDSGVI